jgi:hypothetical protein
MQSVFSFMKHVTASFPLGAQPQVKTAGVQPEEVISEWGTAVRALGCIGFKFETWKLKAENH